MHIPTVELHEAATLAEAAATLVRHAPDVRLLAGGTDLLVDLKTGRLRVGHLVSVSRVPDLRGVAVSEAGLRIAALTTITELDRALVADGPFAPLLDATRQMAGPQIRNVATVGGNIAAAVPCADLPPILIAMHASVELWSPSGQRSVPLEAFFVGPRRTVRRDDEVLTNVVVPAPPPEFGAAYARFALRAGNAIAVASVAAGVRLGRGGAIQEARVVLGAVAPIPVFVESAGAALLGQQPADAAFARAAEIARQAAQPISDVRGSADFRRELVAVLTRRALATACDRAREVR
jgi:CO/xanthine dehydrogenase FAD-binding subunit